MKIRLTGKQRKRQAKNLVVMAENVSIVVGGGKPGQIPFGSIGGVRGSKRKYQFSFDPNQPVTSVTSRENLVDAPPPPEEGTEPPTQTEQSLVQGALGRLGTLLGGYAYDYARQALWRSGTDFLRTNGTFNNQTDPNEVQSPARVAPQPGIFDTVDDIFYVPGYDPTPSEIEDYYAPGLPAYSPASDMPTSQESAMAAVGRQAAQKGLDRLAPPYSPPPAYGSSGPGPLTSPSTNPPIASNASPMGPEIMTGSAPTGLTPTVGVSAPDVINLASPKAIAPGQSVPAVYDDRARYRQKRKGLTIDTSALPPSQYRKKARGLRIDTSLARRGSTPASSPTPTTAELMDFMRTYKPKSGTPVPYGGRRKSAAASATPTTAELMDFMRTYKPKSGTPVPYGRK